MADFAFASLHSLDQWRRAAHSDTALLASGTDFGEVSLAWSDEPDAVPWDDAWENEPTVSAGMAFDPWGRLYRARPELGQVDIIRGDAGPEALFAPPPPPAGEFAPLDAEGASGGGPLGEPVDLCVDRRGQLFVAEQGARRVSVYDLMERRLLRRVQFDRPPRALACDGERVWVLLWQPGAGSPALMRMTARTGPEAQPLPESVVAPRDLAAGETLYLLDAPDGQSARLLPLSRPDDAFPVPGATHIAVRPGAHAGGGDIVCVASGAGSRLERFACREGSRSELPPLRLHRYDGRGLVLHPDGDIAYWSTGGRLLKASRRRLRYCSSGRVTSFRLDSGDFQTQWGRLFIDACIPRGTSVSARCLVLDEMPEVGEPLPRTPPANTLELTLSRPDLSPPMPPRAPLQQLEPKAQKLFRRGAAELPWADSGDGQFVTYEAPITAPPGRYLWVQLELRGADRKTPRIRRLRAEYPSHDLLRRLPRVYSRGAAEADFLRRYLALPEGVLRDLDLAARYRQILLDPMAAPAEVLPWLAGFVGLVLDRRWPEAARRRMIADCAWLFRFRGTVSALKRMVEIYLGGDVRVDLVEHFKLRGLGGALLEGNSESSNAILGAGMRVGGELSADATAARSINGVSTAEAIDRQAHRFSLLVAAPLGGEQLAVIRHLLDEHRPAHTAFDICTLDGGMQLGLGLYAGLTSLVGAGSGFGQLQLGTSVLGRGDLIGRPRAGTVPGSGRLGWDTQVG